MRIVAAVRNDEGIFGKVGGGKIGRKFRKEDQILRLRGSVLHIGHVREWIVANQIIAGVTSGVASRRQIFGVRLPGFACGEEFGNYVVIGYGKMIAASLNREW